jgi:hypothetical protein
MRAPHPFALGLILLGIAAWRADGQGLRVAVAVNAPPIGARVVIGAPMYSTYHPRRAGVWITNAYLARLHHRHMVWVTHEQARLETMVRYDRRYWKAVRAFERERALRERELDRAYDRWLRDQERAHRKGHRR